MYTVRSASESNPIPEFANLSLEVRESTKDLAGLLEQGVIDQAGRVIETRRCLDLSVSDEVQRTIRDVLGQKLVCNNQETSLKALLAMIQDFLGQQYQGCRLSSEELYKVLGAQFLFERFPYKALLSDGTVTEVSTRGMRPLERLWIFVSCSHDLHPDRVEQLYVRMRGLGTTVPFHDPANHLSQIVLNGTPTITFVFPTVKTPCYFATGDALQVSIGRDCSTFSLVDHGVGMQWAVDTLFKIVRVPPERWQNQLPMFLRYLRQGYQPLGDEYRQCLAHQLTVPRLRALWQEAKHSVSELFFLLDLAVSGGYHDEALAFCTEAITRVDMQPPKKEQCDFLILVACALRTKTPHQIQAVARHFHTMVSSFKPPLSEIVYKAVQPLLALPDDPLDIDGYIDLLVCHPTLQATGFDLLSSLQGHTRLKSKWISKLIQSDENRATALIRDVQDSVSEPVMRQWIQTVRQKDTLIRTLSTYPKWQKVAVDCEPLLCVHICVEAPQVELASHIQAKIDINPVPFLPTLFTPQAVRGVPGLVTRALTVLTTRKNSIPEEIKRLVRTRLPDTLQVMRDAARFEEMVLAIKVFHQYIDKTLSDTMLGQLRFAKEQPIQLPKGIANWCSTLIHTEVSAPPLPAPEVPAPVVKKEAVKDVPTHIRELIALSPPDPRSEVFRLLEQERIKSTKLWMQVFQAFTRHNSFQHIATGLSTLWTMKKEFSPEALRGFFDEFASPQVLMRAMPLALAIDEFIRIYQTKEEELRSLALQFLKAAVLTETKLATMIFSSLYSWLERLSDTTPDKFVLASQLLIKACNAGGGFSVSCMYLRYILGHTKVIGGPKRGAKKTPAQLQPVPILETFMKYALGHIDSPECEPILVELVQKLHSLQVLDLHKLIIDNLGALTLPKVRDALIPCFIDLLKQSETPPENYVLLFNNILNETKLSKVARMYREFAIGKDQKSPSQSTTDELPAQSREDEKITSLTHVLAWYFETYIARTLSSEHPADALIALDIWCALRLYTPENISKLFFPEGKDDRAEICTLFVSLLDHFSWKPTTINLCNHLFHVILKPYFSMTNSTTHDRQSYELMVATSPPFMSYEEVGQGVALRIPTLHISRFTPEFLLSELEYQRTVVAMMTGAWKRAGLEGERVVLLDFAARTLRNYIHLYPQDKVLPNLIPLGVFAIQPQTPLFARHQQIFLGIIRQAVLHGVIASDSPKVLEWLCHLQLDPSQLTKTDAHFEETLREDEASTTLTERQYFDLLTLFLQWQETYFTGDFEARHGLLLRLFALIQRQPDLLSHREITNSFFMIFAPYTKFLGAGTPYACRAAGDYLNMLFELYEKSSPGEHFTLMSLIIQTLNRTKMYHAFEEAYGDFVAWMHKFFTLLTSSEFELNEDLLRGITLFLTDGVGKREDIPKRIALMDAWISMCSTSDLRSMQHIAPILIDSEIILSFTEETSPILCNWLKLCSSIAKDPHFPLDELAVQVFFAIKPFTQRASFLESLPPYIKKEVKSLKESWK